MNVVCCGDSWRPLQLSSPTKGWKGLRRLSKARRRWGRNMGKIREKKIQGEKNVELKEQVIMLVLTPSPEVTGLFCHRIVLIPRACWYLYNGVWWLGQLRRERVDKLVQAYKQGAKQDQVLSALGNRGDQGDQGTSSGGTLALAEPQSSSNLRQQLSLLFIRSWRQVPPPFRNFIWSDGGSFVRSGTVEPLNDVLAAMKVLKSFGASCWPNCRRHRRDFVRS